MNIPPTPAWIVSLRSPVQPAYLKIADDVWSDRDQFIRWPREPRLFMPGVVRPKSGFHAYTSEQKELFRAAKLRTDTRTNGPAVMAFLLAGGVRPNRANEREAWTIHHIYDGQFPAPSRQTTTRAVANPEHFTQAAGLVAIHPIADALADELAYFAWLLRWEAFIRFGFDPDGVFGASG